MAPQLMTGEVPLASIIPLYEVDCSTNSSTSQNCYLYHLKHLHMQVLVAHLLLTGNRCQIWKFWLEHKPKHTLLSRNTYKPACKVYHLEHLQVLGAPQLETSEIQVAPNVVSDVIDVDQPVLAITKAIWWCTPANVPGMTGGWIPLQI